MADPDTGKIKRLINYRPLFELSVAMMAGICAYLPIGEAYHLAFVLGLSAAACLTFILKKRRLSYAFAAALLGFVLAAVSMPKPFNNGNSLVRGVVVGTSEKSGKAQIILSHAELDGESFNKRVLMEVGDLSAYSVGDLVEASADIRLPSARFGTYNELQSRLASGIGCIAKARTVKVISKHNAPVTEFLLNLRGFAEDRIHAAFGEDAGIFIALMLGEKDEIGEERYASYRATGTAHLLAISGFHIGVIVGAVGALLPKNRKKLRFAVILSVLISYCTIAAYAPGIVRAAIMTVSLMLADLLERRNDQLSALSLAAILMLVVEPFGIYSIGFQLSFSAVFGIALFQRSFNDGLLKLRFPASLASAVAVSACAILGTLAFQLRYYSSFSPYSVLVNLAAVPAFSFIVVLGIAALFLAFVSPPAAAYLAMAPRGMLFAVEELLELASKLPYAQLEFETLPMLCSIIYLVMLFSASEYLLRPLSKRLASALVLFALLILVFLKSVVFV